MRPRSAWSRGLLYGGIFAGAMSVFPGLAVVFGDRSALGELALVGGLIVSIWGGLGFLAGYASHGEQRAGTAGPDSPIALPSFLRRLVYRFVAGMLLSYIAGMVICGLSVLAVLLLDATHPVLENQVPVLRQGRVVILVGICGLCGAGTGTVTACWLGAMLARGGNVLKPIARAAFAAAPLGTLWGGWFGTSTGILWLWLAEFQDMTAIMAAIAGSIGGMLVAIVMRLLPEE